jgi:hypothetical protein
MNTTWSHSRPQAPAAPQLQPLLVDRQDLAARLRLLCLLRRRCPRYLVGLADPAALSRRPGPILLKEMKSRGSWLVSVDSLLSKAMLKAVAEAAASISSPSFVIVPLSHALTQSVTSMLMKLAL